MKDRRSQSLKERERTFAPGSNDIFWCRTCNVPLLAEECTTCHSPGQRITLSPPADIRLCSTQGKELLKDLFSQKYGYSEFLDGKVILLNKIAGIDRRDQVYLDGYHIATLWFDITTGTYKLDLEMAGAAMLAEKASKNIVVCTPALLKGHVKGKWINKDLIESQPASLEEGDSVILKIGKFVGVGTVRRRGDVSLAIRVKEITQAGIKLSDIKPTIEEVIKANQEHLKSLEKTALKELRDYFGKTRLPINVSFSGGKDSLASMSLCLKLRPKVDVLYIDTKLEFPETLEYVRDFCSSRKLKLHVIGEEINGDESNLKEKEFFRQAITFGPPAKDFRWCCKTNKLGPLTSFIQKQCPKGCVTVEGRRIYESFNRARIGAVERNPYVPNQTTLNPIRDWKALDVMLYIYWNQLTPNPLYDQDYERIGCWLCPASLQSELANTKKIHPELYNQLNSFLSQWAKENRVDPRFIDWGLWRWRSHPPKIVEMADLHGISLKIQPSARKEVGLDLIRGQSPCGLDYSIEANLVVPQNYPFNAVANALCMIGKVKFSEELGVAILETKKGKATVFASGHILIVAPKDKADELLKNVVETIIRVQTCTHCGICEKSCKQRAIKVKDTIEVDESRCISCGKCAKGCISASQAQRLFHNVRKEEMKE